MRHSWADLPSTATPAFVYPRRFGGGKNSSDSCSQSTPLAIFASHSASSSRTCCSLFKSEMSFASECSFAWRVAATARFASATRALTSRLLATVRRARRRRRRSASVHGGRGRNFSIMSSFLRSMALVGGVSPAASTKYGRRCTVDKLMDLTLGLLIFRAACASSIDQICRVLSWLYSRRQLTFSTSSSRACLSFPNACSRATRARQSRIIKKGAPAANGLLP